MADDKVRKLAEEALNRLSADLEAGKSESLKKYLAAMGRFHRYSWGNVLLISSNARMRRRWRGSTHGTIWGAGSRKAKRAS